MLRWTIEPAALLRWSGAASGSFGLEKLLEPLGDELLKASGELVVGGLPCTDGIVDVAFGVERDDLRFVLGFTCNEFPGEASVFLGHAQDERGLADHLGSEQLC